MHNIANVVHDLNPVVEYLHEKITDLRILDEQENKGQFFDEIAKIMHDVHKLENYLKALEKEVHEHKIIRSAI